MACYVCFFFLIYYPVEILHQSNSNKPVISGVKIKMESLAAHSFSFVFLWRIIYAETRMILNKQNCRGLTSQINSLHWLPISLEVQLVFFHSPLWLGLCFPPGLAIIPSSWTKLHHDHYFFFNAPNLLLPCRIVPLLSSLFFNHVSHHDFLLYLQIPFFF